MNRIKLNEYFFLDEFICPEIYLTANDNGRSQISEKIFSIAFEIRKKINVPITINNWFNYFDGLDKSLPLQTRINMVNANSSIMKNRGLRDKNTSVGAPLSAHKQGLAIDIDIKGMTAYSMYQWAKDNKKFIYELGVGRIEHYSLTGGNGRGWLHMDLRNHGKKQIQIINLTQIIELWKI